MLPSFITTSVILLVLFQTLGSFRKLLCWLKTTKKIFDPSPTIVPYLSLMYRIKSSPPSCKAAWNYMQTPGCGPRSTVSEKTALLPNLYMSGVGYWKPLRDRILPFTRYSWTGVRLLTQSPVLPYMLLWRMQASRNTRGKLSWHSITIQLLW